MRDFRTLDVWQKAHRVAVSIYNATERFPRDEVYGLTAQMRRASVSIPANIAEGCGRSGETEFARFLQIALGSASELQYHLLLARELQFISDDNFHVVDSQVTEVKRMLARLIQKLKADS